ncbi:MAG: hypothetical protein GWN12_02215, partial [Thermoplasmata archaeon]|nr:hypothetical protein [Thermoplasmata archaeon]
MAEGEVLEASGLKVVYEGTDNVHPPAGTCLVVLRDNDSDSSVQGNSPDGVVELSILADDETDLEEKLTVELQDLPGTARAISNRSFSIRVDADPPRLEDPIPDSDDWHSSFNVIAGIVANDTGTSGIDVSTLDYSYLGPAGVTEWTQEDLSIAVDGPKVEAMTVLSLPDGVGYWVRWRVKDMVGNPYTISDRTSIRVDTRNVSFANPYPRANEWQNTSDVACGVTIRDLDGSGIDV